MPDKYYDVIVIGRSIGALAAAALLARRDFTVLVLGQRRRSADYSFEGRTLRRRAFTMLAASSPVWHRLVTELATSQTWKRRTKPLSPMVQFLLDGQRFEMAADPVVMAQEVEREFPGSQRTVGALYANFERVNNAADAGFARDAVWPPGTFMERRQTSRIASTLPFAQAEPHADLLVELARDHPYRDIVRATVRFSTDLSGWPPAFAVARLHGAWTHGLVALDGGERELDDMLLGRITANGGVHLLGEQAIRVVVERNRVTGVQIDGDSAPIGAGFVISDLSGEELAALAEGEGISKKAQREWPRVSPSTHRYVASILVRKEGVPSPLGREGFVFSRPGDPIQSTIHLQRALSEEDNVLLTAEVLRVELGRPPLSQLRAWLVRRLCRELPFLERHLVLVDSTHDGLPLWRYESNGRMACAPQPVDRGELRGAPPRSEAMERQLEVDPPGYLGLAGEPVRGPIERSLLVGKSVLPGLGQEGQLLAAWGAARIVDHSDKRKARMRRDMWTKIDIS